MPEQNAADLISLPQGGGALAGIGETFQPDPHTGTGNFQVPLALPPGRGGLAPRLALAYSTGSPNGPFGLGWALSLPQVRRKTSQGIPRYQNASDVFVLSGAEDLVPVGRSEGSERYRPKTETGFARITHVSDPGTGDYWEVWSKDGLRSRYGTPKPPGADVAWSDPTVITGPEGIFAWLISETVDLLGNRIDYSYQTDPAGTAMRYLSEIHYADYGDPASPGYLVSVQLSYAPRPDPFSDRRGGFELRTTQRATGIAISTQAPTPTLASSVELTYADQAGTPASNGVSLLHKITVTGHDGTSTEQLPPIEFGYTDWEPQERRFTPLTGELPASSLGAPGLDLVDLFGDGRPCILELNGFARYWRNRGDGTFDPPRSLRTVPAGVALGAPGVQLADMDGDGRPDLLLSTPTATGYWPLATPPGAPDGTPAGFDPAGYVAARSAPTVSLSDPSVRLIDLDGDGRVDVLRAGAQLLAAYNDGRGSFEELQVLHPSDGLAQINFTDPRVRLADMTGDGLTDIVLLHDRNVDYWPNLGYGRFGARVAMAGPPHFYDGAEHDVTGFDPRRLLLGDVVGDGAADLVYVGDGHVTVWVNQAGNAFADPVVIPGTPRVSDAGAVRLADADGNGVTGVLWSADRVRPRAGYAFLDLTGGVKPYLLNHIDNHRGATTTIEYSTSTAYAEADRQAGRPWRTTLPFPVQVVSQVTVTDTFSQSTLTTQYSYHHGYWDGADREFRGFARVDQRDAQLFLGGTDQHYSPPTETRTWFHLGPVGPEFGDWQPLDLSDEYWQQDPALLGAATIMTLPDTLSRRRQRDAYRALRGSPLRVELYALDGDPAQDRPYTVTEHQYEVTLVSDPPQPQQPPATGPQLTIAAAPAAPTPSVPSIPDAGTPLAFFPHPVGERTTEWERGSDPRTRLKWTDGYDTYGRAHRTVEVAVPRGREPRRHDDEALEPYLATGTAVSYATRDDDHYVCDRQVATARYEILNDGRQSIAELRGAVTSGGGLPLRLLGYGHAFYDGQPLGALGDWGLATGSEQLALTMGQLARAYAPADTITDPPTLPPYLLAGDAVPADGLRAEYFDDTLLGRCALVRPESTLDQAWNGCAPDPVLTPGAFSARWSATINPRYSESYTLTADCEGGIRIWVDGAIVLDAWEATTGGASTLLPLTAGRAVELKVEFKATGADAHARLLWSSASQPQEPIPRDRLAPPPWPVVWGPGFLDKEYPDAFRAVLPTAAGYAYHRADASHFDGYYQNTQRHYDVQDDPRGGRGLLLWEEDALGHRTTVEYDDPFSLLPVKITDAAKLTQTASYDYRVLKPNLLIDANGNQTAVGYTPLGPPAWIAAMGKPNEDVGDLPDHPGTWFIYGLSAYDESPADNRQPVWVHTIKRIDHAWTLINAEAQKLGRPLTPQEIAALLPPSEPETSPEHFIQRREHSDGFGRLLQARNQADDLVVDDLGLPSDATVAAGAVLVHQQEPATPRVTVSGWQTYDNKGRVVEKWEPFIDQGWDYAPPTAARLTGELRKVTTYYDPRGLAVRTLNPDGSETRVLAGIPPDLADPDQFAPTPWETYTYDPNDNAGATDPTGSQAWKDHWNTPSSALQDALGRVVASTERTTANKEQMTESHYDIDGNLLDVTDPLGRRVSYACYDALKRVWRTELLDAGVTRSVLDPLGGALEQRDSKDALALTDFDELHRQRRHWARDRPIDLPTLHEVAVYGEQSGVKNPAGSNLLGRVYESYDEAGRQRTPSYDFAGNLLEKQRQVLSTELLLSGVPGAGGDWSQAAYRVNWEPPAGQTIGSYADTLLDPTTYDITTTYDALKRPTTIQAPVDVTGHRCTLTPTYDRAGALTHIELDGAPYIERLAHNARGQRTLCVLGNGTMTRYAYDPDTFRLARLCSEPCQPMGPSATGGPTGWRPSGAPVQDHGYAYDLVGNLLSLTDTTPGAGIPPQPDLLRREFTYDPLYRLLSATGREADLTSAAYPWIDNPAVPDATKVRGYTESYLYDAVGNLLNLNHQATTSIPGGSYVRTFNQDPAGNRLQSLTSGASSYSYTYDACGNLTSETTSHLFEWDHANRLATYRTQPTPSTEPSIYTQYRYDSGGQRVLKVTRNQGGALRVTAYIDGLFERLILTSAGTSTEHDTLHVLETKTRVALVHVGAPAPGDTTPSVLYQLADHLGSSEVVLDAAGAFVSREEFLPYGETSFGGYAKKRYRFTGKERDEESGLYYHGARYYAPWLCRWTSCDPAGIVDGPALYGYARDNPLSYVDQSGQQSTDPDVTGTTPVPAPTGGSGTDIAMPGPDASNEELLNFAAAHPETVGEYRITVSAQAPDDDHGLYNSVDLAKTVVADLGMGPATPYSGPRPTTDLDRLTVGVMATNAVVLGGVVLYSSEALLTASAWLYTRATALSDVLVAGAAKLIGKEPKVEEVQEHAEVVIGKLKDIGAVARTEPRSLVEQLALDEAAGGAGRRIMQGEIQDPMYPEDVWAKMQYVRTHPDGTQTIIHYWENLQTGLREGFKFK